jgi:glycosyltransferase involved in cell wall biosynthesis
MAQSARISIALCSFNGSAYLAKQLESLVLQNRLPDEIVICDDASTDGSGEMIREFAKSAGVPVILHIHPMNVGTTANFQSAIEKCSGDWIALCDQDDIWLPGKLARIEEEIQNEKDVALRMRRYVIRMPGRSDMGFGNRWDLHRLYRNGWGPGMRLR